MSQSRVRRGVPTGGQWSIAEHPEGDLLLVDDVPGWDERKARIVEIRAEVDELLSPVAGEERRDTRVRHAAAEQLVIEAGSLIDSEVLERVGPPPVRGTDDEIAAGIEQLQADRERLLALNQRRTELRMAGAPEGVLRREYQQAEADHMESDDRLKRLMGNDVGAGDWAAAQAAAARDLLAEIRPFGDQTGVGHKWHPHAQPAAIKEVSSHLDYYPADWVENSVNGPLLAPKKTRGRAHYCPSKVLKRKKTEQAEPRTFSHKYKDLDRLRSEGEYYKTRDKIGVGWEGRPRKVLGVEIDEENMEVRITYSGGRRTVAEERVPGAVLTVDGDESTVIHELAHRMEHVNPRLAAMERSFYARRVTGEDGELERARSYQGRSRERVRPDGFVDEYVGKDYGDGRYYEVMSVGMQSVFAGDFGSLSGVGGAKPDPDHRAFVLGALASL